jgi:threonine dehydrogenase-like Zn-dependent dehydrogenase
VSAVPSPDLEIVARPELSEALATIQLPDRGAVFDATAPVDTWEEAREVLMGAFALSGETARAEASFVYVVHSDDLLGRRGAPSAIVATGLLSGARTAAIELSRKGAVVNVVAVGDDTRPDVTARWVARLLEPDGPTGEVVRLDPVHIGKALP